MRFLPAGLVLLLLIPASAAAQATGQVLKIGFQNTYRPDCWTPMLVQLTSQSPETRKYQVQIVQEDLDSDRETYNTPDIVVEGNKENQPTVVEYWVYFRPKPTGRGLPEPTGVGALADLQAQLKVYLCDASGKQLSVLPLTSTISSVDPVRDVNDTSRDRKLVLFVSDGADQAAIPNYVPLKGAMEDVVAVAVSPRNNDFPGNVIGYEAVDAIVWMDADAKPLTEGTNRSLDAVKEWVRQGGKLIVTEPDQPYKLDRLAELLPVKSAGGASGNFSLKMEQRLDFGALPRLLEGAAEPAAQGDWVRPPAPVSIARASPTDDAIVEQWVDWPTPDPTIGTRTPYVARRAYGLGSVTWVAQDLGSKTLTGDHRRGWPVIWDRLFGVNNKTVGEDADEARQDVLRKKWADAPGADLGYSLLGGMELANKTSYLIFIASLFFIVYWVVAGPGVYIVLAARKKAYLSWFAYGATAVVATALTVLLVRLVVRGPPEIRHITTYRVAPGGPAVAYSRFGLYIPRDGEQQVILAGSDPRPVSSGYVTAFPIHPQYLKDKDDQFPAYMEYTVSVHDGAKPADTRFPYRSTLKKLQAKWVGTPGGGIDVKDALKLIDAHDKYVQGTLVNHTGRDLTNVYLAFRHPGSAEPEDRVSTRDQTYVVFVEKFPKDATLDLNTLMVKENRLQADDAQGSRRHVPSNSPVVYAVIGAGDSAPGWDRYWYGQMRGSDATAGESMEHALPLLCLFDLLSPMSSQPNSPDEDRRYELFRRNARELDVATAVTAGRLVVFGQAEGPLPFAVQVEGDTIGGEGTTFFEYVLPVDRSAMYPQVVQPAIGAEEKGTTKPTVKGTGAARERSLPNR